MTSSMSAKDGVAVPGPEVPDNQMQGSFRYEVGEADVGTEIVYVSPEEQQAFFQDVPDMPISEFLCRPVKIGNFDLSGAGSPPDIVATSAPWATFLTAASVADKTKHFTYIRGDLEVLLIPAFSPGSYGYFEVCFLPLGGNPTAPWITTTSYQNVYNCRQIDIHVPISATSAQASLVRLPYYWPYDVAAIDPTNFGASWVMNIVRLASLTTSVPGGSATGSVQVYARVVPGYQMTIPSFQAPSGKPKHRYQDKIEGYAGKVNKMLGDQAKSGPVSSVVNSFSKAAEALSGVPIIGSMSDTASKVLGTAANVASWFGFSRAIEESSAMGVYTVPGTNITKCDGQFSGTVGTLLGNGLIENDPSIVGGPPGDFLAFSSLFKRPVLVSSSSWSATTPVGTVLLSLPVTPMFSATSTSPYSLTTAGYCGLPFTFWRGDITYTVRVVMGSLQRGTLQAYWLPYGTSPPSVGDDVTNVTQNIIFDAQADFEFKFTIGYARDIPFLYTLITYNGIPIQPVGATNGYFCLKVVNAFQTQESTATATILIFQHAEDNMTFTTPKTVANFPGVNPNPFFNSFILQAPGGSLGVGGETCKEISLVPSPGAYPSEIIFPGQSVASARALLQKPSPIYPIDYPYSSGDYPRSGAVQILRPYGNYMAIPKGDGTDWNGSYNFSWMTYYSAMCAGIAGSTQYTVFSSAPQGMVSSNIVQPFQGTNNPVAAGFYGPTGLSTMLPLGNNNSTSFLIPYCEPAKFIQPWQPYLTATHEIGFSTDPITAEKAYWVIYQSFGEDVRPTRFLQTPMVKPLPSPSTEFPTSFQDGSLWPVYP